MQFQRYVCTIAAAMFAAAAWAQTTTTSTATGTYNLPPVGLASSETAQINVTNLASNASNGTAASCTGTISFVNASGAVIGTASSFAVAAGKTDSVTLPYSSTAASGRTEIRGVITVPVTSLATLSAPAPCNLVSSMETYDSTSGVTHAFLAGPQATVNIRLVPVVGPGR